MLRVILKPFQRFLNTEASGSILLLLATLAALLWANSPWRANYAHLWETPLPLNIAGLQSNLPLHFWINEGLMTLFFLLVGLEIKREFLGGELSSPRQASLPILGALGGMVVPALIYAGFNPPGTVFAHGWAIPTVTDIAFAIGALTLLGNRVPLGLKVFLIALAIVDDIGAILIIALFYSHGLQPLWLLAAAGLLLLGFALNRSGKHRCWPYLALGVPLWLAILQSGIHPTIAGVLLALTVPATLGANSQPTDASTSRLELETDSYEANLPTLQTIEHGLHPWVTYSILPLFALANAGVHLPWTSITDALGQPLSWGILAGLFLGKPLGITLAAWAAVRLGWASLPAQVNFRQIHAAGVLGGIGFTMSVFITLLAFREPGQVATAKLAILLASGLSAGVGVGLLWWALQSPASVAADTPEPLSEE